LDPQGGVSGLALAVAQPKARPWKEFVQSSGYQVVLRSWRGTLMHIHEPGEAGW